MTRYTPKGMWDSRHYHGKTFAEEGRASARMLGLTLITLLGVGLSGLVYLILWRF